MSYRCGCRERLCLLREDDEVVYGDSAYLGIKKREKIKNNPQLSAIEYRINCGPGRLPRGSDNAIDCERHIDNRKSSVRYKVEHPCRIVKNLSGFRKTVQICIYLLTRAAHSDPQRFFAPFELAGVRNTRISLPIYLFA